MSLHLQPDWQRALGQDVEIRVNGKSVRAGKVDAVMPDDSILWISAEGADSRQMLARADGYEVYTRYPWTYPAPPDGPDSTLQNRTRVSPADCEHSRSWKIE